VRSWGKDDVNRKPLNLILILTASLSLRAAFGAAVPTVTGVSPNSGTANGGTTVVITGTNFNNGAATAVTIGGTAATSYTVVDNFTINAVVPAHATGNVTISVTNGTGTGTSTLANGYTYTSGNVNVQVSVVLTIPKRADIQWGNGTSVDDAGIDHTLAANRITNYTWIVKDSSLGGNTDVNTIYQSNDATNNKTLNISNVSPTNSTNTITAIATNTAAWTIGAAAAANTFRLRAGMNGGALVTLSAVPATLTNSLSKGTDQALVLEMATPTSIAAAAAGVAQTSTVTLVSTAN
jgi:hypothetical protein